MNGELVSIIIPAYNVEKYIERCLESLLSQTYKNIEIIVVDDGSKDDTGIVCDTFAKKDIRIKVLHISNGGVSNARNTGIREASGMYLMFVDSDDYVTEDYVEKNYQAITGENADLAISGAYFKYPKETVTKKVASKYIGTFEKKDFGEAFLWLYQNSFAHVIWNKIYKRQLITEYFRTDMAWGEDMYFNLCYLEKAQKIALSDASCYYYMCDEDKDSLTKRVGADKFISEDVIFQKTLEICKKIGIEDISGVLDLYAEAMIAMLFGVAYSSMSAVQRRKIIGDVCEMESIKMVMPRVKTKYFYSEWIRMMLCRNNQQGLYYLFVLARVVRKSIDIVCGKKRR